MDLSQYVGLFIDEARLHLQQCSDSLLVLENSPDNSAVLNEIFRSIHTIKGMAATLVEFPYFEEISQLSHEMESLLDELRNHTIRLNDRIMDLLFACVDGLDLLIGNVSQPEQATPQDLSYLFAHLAECSAQGQSQPSLTGTGEEEDPYWSKDWQHAYTDSESEKILQASKYGKNCFELRIQLAENCQMKSVRTQLILHKLKQNSEVIKTIPELNDLLAGNFQNCFIISLVTPHDNEYIENEVNSVSEVEALRTVNLLGETIYTAQSPPKLESQDPFAMPELNEFELNVLREAKKLGYGAILFGIKLFPNVVLKAARATLIFRSLEKYGEIIKADPPVIELEEERFGNFFSLILVSQHEADEIRSAILEIPEIKDSLEIQALYVADELLAPKTQVNNIIELPRDKTPLTKPMAQSSHSVIDLPTRPPEHFVTEQSPAQTRQAGTRTSPLVRVDAGKLEQLMQLVDELVLCRAEFSHAIRSQNIANMDTHLFSLGSVATALHSLSIQLQMVSVEQVFNRFPRMIRDLSRSLGKEIELTMDGRELEMDRTLIDELGNALMHMIRNAADHGLEKPEERLRRGKPAKGLIALQASYENDVLRVDVRDDGKGIDTDKLRYKAVERGIVSEQSALQMSQEQALRLVFAPGLSTQDTATDISGRGVGMDAVRTQIESLGGEIRIQSTRGQGTTYSIRIPSQMTMLNAFLVSDRGDFFAIGQDQVDTVTEIYTSEIETQAGKEVYYFNGHYIPLVILADFINPQGDQVKALGFEKEDFWMIVIKRGSQRLGILVDELLGQEELVLKPFSNNHDKRRGADMFSGATVLANGEVALLLDTAQIFAQV
ncbi:hypothetical protein COW36_04040 [bacterium (Candidatus Blackallbacteria) CG17_big_fil_post_rev_8_21_14_2_50_48_46]|uniref:Chemotaxis protein CheA n=1 Tax=bacterium (Candidatus Blackallbacteria) CG17_big_fil_post_rev_8_21_14_2_50_48_46 TaxID=2014261 RepID=A0A2M7G8N3_9BACT|nr:MAG: hypothetical protein COW64_04905 [bacterium (Candidatus Blackallbacteria) CG18_big_fil_WC_8_21_14_2_50_49_26]PIW18469.1 MAG: hypothetical protein COW36_04040 [bacterium (Candidatus Blackallbacteria) CG17_big_fil_post_rev_8_21_14_2_50_48_46]PIW46546.1 MAG: hypothetical protein COW20_16640 [bacterium (Candidatus Blackallbacteria) CG13_big_fil_rev_8_21_14_2_50_49_14]